MEEASIVEQAVEALSLLPKEEQAKVVDYVETLKDEVNKPYNPD